VRPSDPEHDPAVRRLRERIGEQDLAVLAAVNRRIELVRELKEHKLAQGWEFVDRSREEELLAALVAENQGPLSEAGLRKLFAEVLALTKRELDS
jgi:chorismate mutase